MIPDLAWWGRLFGLLATEAALLVALAAVVARLTRSAQWRRLIWQTAFLAVALVWFLELGGGRGWLARWRPAPAPARQVTARVIGESTVRAEPVPFEFPAAVPVADQPPTPQQPLWWPGAFWLAGLAALWLKALGSRVWLAWRIRAVHKPEVGQAASLPTRADSGRLAACPTLNEAPPAEVTATVARLRTVLGVGPVRLVAWPRLRGPVAFGIFRPTVAVPADFATRFAPVQREAMLAHELAHLANRDPLWLLVAELVCALAWWHPLMWWARRQFRAACEAAADEASTVVPGGRVALAEALVNFGRELTAPGGVGVAGSGLKSELARRVKALMEPGDARAVRSSGRWLLRGGMALVLGALLSVPWPGTLGGLGPLWAAVRAEANKPLERSAKPLETVSELLADPRLREVVKAMEAAVAREGKERGPTAVTGSPRLATNVAYEQPAAHELSRSSGFYLEPRVGANPTNILSKLALPGSPLAVAVSGHEAAQLALQTQAKQSQLATRQFRLSARDFTAHLQSYLPVGETNVQALQLAVRAFGATNGVEFPAMITNAPEATPPSDQPAIFYNDRTGQLFVRATLENLERLEAAIQQLNLPAAETDRSRAELVDRLRTTKATLGELLTRYKDGHPNVRAAAKDYFEAKRAAEEPEPLRPSAPEVQSSPKLEALPEPAKLPSAPTTNGTTLFTRQFRVDPDKFAARVLAGFDPAEEAARRTETLPNRSLIASDIGASGSPRSLVRAVSQPSQFGFAGGGDGAELNLLEAALAYFRRQGVEFAPLVANPDAPATPPSESRAFFYKPHTGILFVRASLDDLAKVEQALIGLEPPVASTSMPGPQVQLAVFFVEIEERGADDLGLDWLFGQPRTNNPVPVTQFLTNAPGSATALQGDRLRVERLEVAGQWAVLSGEQFGALRQRLEGRAGVDFLSAPQVITLSDRQAQVSVGDVRTLVTGVVATDGSATNDADIRYVTDQVSVGPVVDLFPRAEGDAWRVRVVASLNEFLGYDAPGKTNRVEARTPGKPPLRRDVPLPRQRKRETQAEALAQPGEIIALRGPLAENVIQTKDKVPVLGDVPLLGRLFRRESTQTQRKRLYVFVQPTTVDAQGKVVEPAGAK